MLQAQATKHGLRKGQIYNFETDGDKVVFKSKRKLIRVPISLLGELKLKPI